MNFREQLRFTRWSLLAILCITAATISAETFEKNSLYIDLQGGFIQGRGKFDDDLQRGLASPLIETHIIANSTSMNRRLVTALSAANPAQPTLKGTHGRLGIELALTKHIGIGASINTTRVFVRNAYQSINIMDLIGIPAVILAPGSGQTSPFGYYRSLIEAYLNINNEPGAVDLLKLIRFNGRLETISSYDMELALHTGGRTFDLYGKLVAATQFPAGNGASKVGAILGLRAFASRFYVTLELFADQYSTTQPLADSFNKPQGETTRAAGIRFGFGVALAHGDL